jgi:hypothetical protein
MWNPDILYFVELWNNIQEEEKKEELDKNKIKVLMSSEEFVMFFKKDNTIYACDENNRLIFAKIKVPDEDSGEWLKEANFMAVNLTKGLKGEKLQNLFSNKDLKSIKVISEEKAEEILLSQAKGKIIDSKVKKSEEEVGTIQLKDKKE